MPPPSIAFQRLSQQRLTRDPLSTPAEVVAWLGAVQAQDYAGAKWSIGQRMPGATDALVEQAFNAGAILRTHVLRPTWHFVAPADIRWMLELTAPRVNGLNAYYYRQNQLDDALFARSNAAIAAALQGGRQLTRAELTAALADAGIQAKGLRLLLIFFRAELDALICSGPRRGKQFTYMLLEERVPPVPSLSHAEALAELTRRYFTGHGPATTRDFAWWSGLTLADVKAGLEMAAAALDHAEVDGQTYWFPAAMPPAPADGPTAHLLPTYDEFLVGFAAFDAARKGSRIDAELNSYVSTIVVNGQVAGSWRRTLTKKTVSIQLAPFTPLAPADSAALSSAAQRYAQFLGLTLDLV